MRHTAVFAGLAWVCRVMERVVCGLRVEACLVADEAVVRIYSCPLRLTQKDRFVQQSLVLRVLLERIYRMPPVLFELMFEPRHRTYTYSISMAMPSVVMAHRSPDT
jgi:hypothetical protein